MNEYENRKCIIGKRIRDEREGKGWGKKEFLKQIFMAESSTKTLSAWEKGERIPDLDSLARMAEVFQCDIGYLLGDYDTRRHKNADICETTGLSESSVEFLRRKKEWESTTEAKVIDLLLADARKRDEEHDYRPITSLLKFFFKYRDGAGQRKQVFSNGMVVDYNRGDGFIASNAIALDGRIVENAVLMEIEGALKSLKQSIQAGEG